MKQHVIAFIAGSLFAFGLALSGMTQPHKIIGFLDIFGTWDPTLLFVMIGAIAVHLVALRLTFRRKAPLLENQFLLPTQKAITPRLIIGSGVFGLGWGLTGFCPGPALTSLPKATTEVIFFVGAMAIGMYLHKPISKFLSEGLSRSQIK
ncbi:MAG: hypothetical protein COB67_02730 [SAR324 cluster bacterium]|uniref:YeeE/YedE family protein n=1 Tax=SAR324 cluster bacterium TaxID=2024889 RepID=A0A2A4TA53_9DELT|nr:MAG: hypothetical protein COB67_02730 [SAR324 cluster bacterium]